MRALAAIPVVLLLAGCGDGDKAPVGKSRQLDTDKVATAIQQSIESQRDLKRLRVVCPDGIPQRKGFSFACLAAFAGGTTTFTVTQKDDQGNVSYEGR